MDGTAVIAFSEVLDKRLPVGVDVVNDRLGHSQILEAVSLEHLEAAKAMPELRLHLCSERISLVVQANPDVTGPLGKANRPKAMPFLHRSGHLPKVRGCE